MPVLFSDDQDIHYDNPSYPLTRIYIKLSTAFNLTQHVTKPTHEKGHILDHIATRDNDSISGKMVSICDFISNHSVVMHKLNLAKAC